MHFCIFFVGQSFKIVYNNGMLISALICMIVASILAAIGLCFTSKKQAMHFLLYTFFLVGLCCVGFIALNFKNTFQAYSILLIIAVLPNFLMLFDMNLEEKNNTQEISISSKKLKNFWNQTNFLLGISQHITVSIFFLV